jgi:small-conductance mechanosensitive channel/CRP-like cAMP-binding protein
MNEYSDLLWAGGGSAFIALWFTCLIIERRTDRHFKALFRYVRNVILPGFFILWALQALLGYQSTDDLALVAKTLFGFILVWFLANVLKVLFFADRGQNSIRARTPRLLVDIVRLCFIVVGCVLVYSSVWHKDISPLLTTFGVGSLVLGLALQDTLGNLFAGLALVFERPVTVGDWIQVGDLIGKVQQINWRSVRVVTRELNEITIPNSAIGKDRITNFSSPSRVFGFKVSIGFSYDAAPNVVRDMLVEAALATPGILSTPAPDPRTLEFGAYAVQYELRVFISAYDDFVTVRNELMTRIWYAARRRGIAIPYPITTLYKTEVPYAPTTDDSGGLVFSLLGKVPLFTSLNESDRAVLGHQVKIEQYGKGEFLMREGEVGDSFFLIVDGDCTVIVGTQDGRTVPAAILQRGEICGEMSLLAGTVRIASVQARSDVSVARISKDALTVLLSRRPELVQTFAHYAAERGDEIEAARNLKSAVTEAVPTQGDERALTERLRRFFGLA